MLRTKPFYYLRHGQTNWNLEHRAQGQQDVPLNEAGRAQAAHALPKLFAKGITTIISSPLRRAKETASILAESLGIPVVVIDSLKEASWGECEGLPKGEWFSLWRSGANNPANAEPYDEFLMRALTGLNMALEYPGPVLIVAHGGTYWAVERATQFELSEDVPNCTPVFHDPPLTAGSHWRVEIL